MKSFLKMLVVAGAFAGVSVFSLAVVQDDVQAEPLVASYYGYELAGSPTASGVPFDPSALTAAHKTLPLGTQLLVSYGGESVVVTVNDRGPYVEGRELDLSQAAADAIGLTAAGSGTVDVQVVE